MEGFGGWDVRSEKEDPVEEIEDIWGSVRRDKGWALTEVNGRFCFHGTASEDNNHNDRDDPENPLA
jgi:hypothetical protein